jgi:hypothetical protein
MILAYDPLGFRGRIPDGDRNHAICLFRDEHERAEVVTNGPQADPGDTLDSWSGRDNVRARERYDGLEHHLSSADRILKECGPINDRQLRVDCIASFGAYDASSAPSAGYRH